MKKSTNIFASITVLIAGLASYSVAGDILGDSGFVQAQKSLAESAWGLHIPGKQEVSEADICGFKNGIVTLRRKKDERFFLLQRNLPLEKGKKYEVSYEVKSSAGVDYSVYVEWITDKNSFHGAPRGEERRQTSSEAWNRRSFAFTYDFPSGRRISSPPYIVFNLLTPGTVSFRNISLKAAGDNGEAMAGMARSDVLASSASALTATLTGIDQAPPTVRSWRPNQLGNSHEPLELTARKSSQIGKSIAGILFSDFHSSPEDKGGQWSTSALIYGLPDPRLNDDQNCFSSMMHRSANVCEWVQIELAKSTYISKVTLLPRNKQGIGFPHDFQIWVRDVNQPWVKLVDEVDFDITGRAFPLEFTFEPKKARYVKVLATRLRREGNVYYFQLSRVGVFNEDGENLALLGKGAEAIARCPLSIQQYDYDYLYDTMFDAGIKWTITCIRAHDILERVEKGKTPFPENMIKNMKYKNKNGVNVTLRLGVHPDWILEGDKGLERYLEMLRLLVEQFRGQVGIWAILNEENMYNMYRYKAAIDKYPSATPEAWKQAYVRMVSAASDMIRKLDPGVPIQIETALFDFGWTEDVLKMGLKDKVDLIGVHVYKESPTEQIMPEMVSTFIKDGRRRQPAEQPFKSYMEEITAYQELLRSINPDIRMTVSETCVNLLLEPGATSIMAVSEKSQAKFLARLYWLHYCFDIGATAWWGFFNTLGSNTATAWGIHDVSGRRLDAWYALRNVSAIMDNSFKTYSGVRLNVAPQNEKLFSQVFKNDSDTILIPYWMMVPMRDYNTGLSADFRIVGIDIKSAEVIDMFTGSVHELDYQRQGDEFIFNGMVIRDYPLVIRINHR